MMILRGAISVSLMGCVVAWVHFRIKQDPAHWRAIAALSGKAIAVMHLRVSLRAIRAKDVYIFIVSANKTPSEQESKRTAPWCLELFRLIPLIW